ncbi:MAG TPA: DUF6232 family protein [Actinoplanes sp.]|jgi:hypothetical protein
MSTRTYYRGPDAVVTDQLFVWLTQPTKGYVVRDLRSVGLVRAEGSRLRSYTLHVAGATLVLAAATWMALDSPAGYVLGAFTIATPSAFAVARLRMRPQRWELHATYRGTRVLLYASFDVRVFNQVVRALRRAVEDARPPVDHRDLAAA